MENVLYEYSFNVWDHLGDFIPLFIGIAVLFFSINARQIKNKQDIHDSTRSPFIKNIGFIVSPFCFLVAALCFFWTHTEHAEHTRRLANDDVCVVQGYVEQFQPQICYAPDITKCREQFEINGVYFEYSSHWIVRGYHTPASRGGVVTENGQHLKIKYIVKDDGEELQNIILYIAEITP